MAKFKRGAVVRLRSGGPPMTVEYTVFGDIHLAWFEGDRKVEGFFHEDLLEPAEAPVQDA